MQYPKQQPITNVATDASGNGIEHYDDATISTHTKLYTCTGPFYGSIDAYVQVVLGSTEQWFIALHITVHGGNGPRVFRSGTPVPITAGEVTLVAFPQNSFGLVSSDSYGIITISAQYNDGLKAYPNTIGIILTTVGRTNPVISIIHTEISPTWMMGHGTLCLPTLLLWNV